MRAVTVTEYGGPEALRLSEVALPQPGPGEVRVAVAARPVNPIDVFIRSGALKDMVPARDSYTPGLDFAGTVDAVGPGVSEFAVGAPVIGLSPWFVTQAGSYADAIVVPAEVLAAAPRTVDLTAASTLPLNGITAALAVNEVALSAGTTVLVTGAAGGVGGYAVQLAANAGARVLAVAASEDADLVRSLGATTVLAKDVNLVEAVHQEFPSGVDAVIDAASLGTEVIGALRDGGRFAAVLSPAAPESERGITVATIQHAPDGAMLAKLATDVDARELTLRVADTFPLTDAASAHERFEKGGLRGRIVLVK